MTENLTLVVVGKDTAAVAEFFEANREFLGSVELALIANENIESLAAIGNRFLESAKTPVVGLVHADTFFKAGALDIFTQTAMEGKVCGIVGRPANGNASKDHAFHWCFVTPGPVETLDSCSVFLRKDLGLRFDAEKFNGFHCHVQDLCMQAHARGIEVVVPTADATHRGINWAEPDFRADYAVYQERLNAKWGREVKVT